MVGPSGSRLIRRDYVMFTVREVSESGAVGISSAIVVGTMFGDGDQFG